MTQVKCPMSDLSPAMKFALQVAAQRSRRTMCPVKTAKGRIHNAAEGRLLDALQRRGLIEYDGPIPYISAAGLAVVETIYRQLSARN